MITELVNSLFKLSQPVYIVLLSAKGHLLSTTAWAGIGVGLLLIIVIALVSTVVLLVVVVKICRGKKSLERQPSGEM